MAKLRVRDLMTSDPVALTSDASLREARDLMYGRDIRHIPVIGDDGEVVGLLSHRDLGRRVLGAPDDQLLTLQDDVLQSLTVRDIMTADVECVEPEIDVIAAGQLMLDNKYGCLPVTEDARLVGILTEADFVRHLVEAEKAGL